MYEILTESQGKLLGLRVSGKVTAEDYESLIPEMERRIDAAGPLRLLCDMRDFGGIEIEAFWADFKFSVRHLKDFERMAVVGDQRWLEWWTKAASPFVKTQVKCFGSEEIREAWAWLRA